MGRLNYSTNHYKGIYTVSEKGVDFIMRFSYFSRLFKFINKHYGGLYNEETGGVLAWYRGELTAPERKDIKVYGLDSDTGFFADPVHQD